MLWIQCGNGDVVNVPKSICEQPDTLLAPLINGDLVVPPGTVLEIPVVPSAAVLEQLADVVTMRRAGEFRAKWGAAVDLLTLIDAAQRLHLSVLVTARISLLS